MLSENTLNVVVKELGYAATAHGMRSTFRDWAGDCTHAPREISEAALGHIIGNEVEAAYRRSDALAKRRHLMQQWARFIDTPWTEYGDNVRIGTGAA